MFGASIPVAPDVCLKPFPPPILFLRSPAGRRPYCVFFKAGAAELPADEPLLAEGDLGALDCLVEILQPQRHLLALRCSACGRNKP